MEDRLEALHFREERLTGANREMLTGKDAPFREAVRVALLLEVTVPAVAVKEAEVKVAGTVNVAGTAKAALLEESETMAPPVGAAPDSVTVQKALALDVRLEALHCSE